MLISDRSLNILISLFIIGSLATTNFTCPRVLPFNQNSNITSCYKKFIISRSISEADIATIQIKTNERLVATTGHVAGLKPESYKLNFEFRNKTNYEASAEITVTVKQRTNRIILNQHSKAPEIAYEKIRVDTVCDGVKTEPICIEKVQIFSDNFVIQVTKAMEPGEQYLITIPSFRSKAYEDQSDSGSIGLSSTGSDQQGYWGLTTIFQMRYARSVFPCFDYPSMKAKFQLCIHHLPQWRPATNTPLSRPSQPIRDSLVESCFQATPPISTYLFTIALMENYTVNSMKSGNGPLFELYSPLKKAKDLVWILDNTKKGIDRMRSITNIDYPLSKLSLYVVYPAPFWGIENLGMVTLEGAFMEMGPNAKRAITILNHEIVHQWIGDLTTISEWREICLQEGLTAFLEWKLSEDLQNISMQSQSEETVGEFRRDNDAFLARFNKTQDIAERCFGLPPLFLKTIHDYYGFETIQNFVRKLLKNKLYQNANISYWDQVLVESTNEPKLSGYFQSWFGQPGSAYLFISRPNERKVLIQQGQVENFDTIAIRNDTIRPMPLRILASNGQMGNLILPRVQNVSIPLGRNANDSWNLLDPDGLVVVRKVYDLKSYQSFFCPGCDRKFLTPNRLKRILTDFCQVLLFDKFPWGRDKLNFDSNGWSSLLQNLSRGQALNDGECKCCIRAEEDNLKKKECFWKWNHDCKQLRINQLLGRNYTLPPGSPFVRPGPLGGTESEGD